MAPEALREDPGRLDGRRVVQVCHDGQRPDRKTPRPALSLGVVLGLTRHLDDAEDRLPDRRVQDATVSFLYGRPLRRRVPPDLVPAHARAERAVAPPTDEQPARQSLSTTPAIAWPKPMHIVAMP